MMQAFAYLILTLIIPLTTKAAVWVHSEKWSAEQEELYSQWVQNEVKEDIFSSSLSPWYGLGTDCADAAYALRAIYAYTKKLPVRFLSQESLKGGISNSMTTWDHLPAEKRIFPFIRYLAEKTSTLTLGHDTYPVALTPQTLRPGMIFLNPTLSREEQQIIGTTGGHAEIIWNIEDNGYIRTLYSTTPVAVRQLLTTRNPYTWPLSRQGGFRRWYNPEDRGLPRNRLPGYSEEQFSLAGWSATTKPTRKQIYQWHESIRKIIRLRPPTIEERQDVVIESICNLWQGRALAVRNAWREIQANRMRCLSAGRMDDHSTERRDARIREAYGQLNDLAYWKKKEYGSPTDLGNIRDLEGKLKQCKVSTDVAILDAWELFLRMIDGQIISNSIYEPAVRWGQSNKVGGVRCH